MKTQRKTDVQKKPIAIGLSIEEHFLHLKEWNKETSSQDK